MSGKHRKQSQVQTTVAKCGGTGLAAAALSVTGLSTAVVTGTTAAVAPNVQLSALVSAANSTSQFFAGSTYYGTNWTTVYDDQQVVPFLQGPQGIANTITNVAFGADSTGVTASGWGAGQAGTALGIVRQNDIQNGTNVIGSIGLVILDNNTNRAGGGFWTTYGLFAPLLFTTSDPTPNNIPGLTVLDVAYEYNINSDAPVDPLNPFALGNSLAAYAFDYGAENRTLNITQDEPGATPVYTDPEQNETPLLPGRHYIVASDGSITSTPIPNNPDGTPVTTTYITVESANLPLTRPLRLIPGGDILANALDPMMTDLVDAGYNDGLGTPGDPAIPANPTVPRPMKPFSSLGALAGVPNSAQDGVTAGATTAFDDIGDPSKFITKPLGEIAKLPVLSTLTNPGAQTNNVAAAAKSDSPTTKKTTSSPSSTVSERPKPLKKIRDDIRSSLHKLTGADDNDKPAADDGDQ